jgi:two-component system, NtrC family, sensor kinase
MIQKTTDKRKENSFPYSEELCRAFFEQTSDGIFVATSQGELLEVNCKLCELLNYTRKKILTLSLNDILNEEDLAYCLQKKGGSKGNSGQLSECQLYNSKGDILTVELRIIPLVKGCLLGIAHNPKEQIRREEQFYKSEERFQVLAESSLTGMYLIQDGQFSYVNKEFAKMFGYEVDEVLNDLKMTDLIYPHDHLLVQENIQRRIEGVEDSIRYVFRGLRKDGSIIYVEVHGGRIQYLGKPGVIGTLIDVTAAKRAEEELRRLNEKLEAKVEERTLELKKSYRELKLAHTNLLQKEKMASVGQLAAGIAHEINTPIQFISDNIAFLRESVGELLLGIQSCHYTTQSLEDTAGTCTLIKDLKAMLEDADLDYLKKEIPLAFESSFEGIRRISSIVLAMKEFAHPSGNNFAPVDLENLVKTTSEISRNAWKEVAELIIESAESPLIVEGLKDDLGQVMLNLIMNAADAITEKKQKSDELGRICIQIRNSGENWAEILVEDSGCGMQPELKRKIFEPFFTTKAVGRGSGQGLAIAYSIVKDKHGGELLVDSLPGKGSTFSVLLPILQGE